MCRVLAACVALLVPAETCTSLNTTLPQAAAFGVAGVVNEKYCVDIGVVL